MLLLAALDNKPETMRAALLVAAVALKSEDKESEVEPKLLVQ
jgi:hypothetical protein